MHHVDTDGIGIWSETAVADDSGVFTWADNGTLRADMDVGEELEQPCRKWNGVAVLLVFVQGLEDQMDVLIDGRMVTILDVFGRIG